MKITRKSIDAAVEDEIISAEQAQRLFEFLQRHGDAAPRFDFTHVLYYLGGLIAIGAMTIFMNLGWESFGGWGILAITVAYAAVGLKLTAVFQRNGYAIPAGICAVFVVALTPLAVYALQQALGVWPEGRVYREYHRHIEWHWLYMELATLAVGAVVSWKYRYPFLTLPIAFTLWYMSMDIAAMIAGGREYFTSASIALRATVSMYFGLLMLLHAFWVDIRARKSAADYAFWLYIFGVLAFWGGMSMQDTDSELRKFAYLCINLLMLGVGVVLLRRVFVIFAALGICGYFGHLAMKVFEDSWLFPFALTLLGLAVIYLGVIWQRNERQLTQRARRILPVPLKELLDAKSS